MGEYIHVVTTTENRHDAEQIARALIEKREAACVQIVGPVTSIYRWQGQIETAQEWQCHIKSRRQLYGQIETTIRSLHPYQTPEIVAFRVLEGSEAYLNWIDAETAGPLM